MKNTEYDFESVIDRTGTDSLKWELFDDDLPMWVADMDFKVAPAIHEAILAVRSEISILHARTERTASILNELIRRFASALEMG